MKLNEEQLKEVIMRLVGPINPAGDASRDDERFENLKLICAVVDSIVTDIDHVSYSNKDSHQHSVKRAADYASDFMTKTLGVQ